MNGNRSPALFFSRFLSTTVMASALWGCIVPVPPGEGSAEDAGYSDHVERISYGDADPVASSLVPSPSMIPTPARIRDPEPSRVTVRATPARQDVIVGEERISPTPIANRIPQDTVTVARVSSPDPGKPVPSPMVFPDRPTPVATAPTTTRPTLPLAGLGPDSTDPLPRTIPTRVEPQRPASGTTSDLAVSTPPQAPPPASRTGVNTVARTTDTTPTPPASPTWPDTTRAPSYPVAEATPRVPPPSDSARERLPVTLGPSPATDPGALSGRATRFPPPPPPARFHSPEPAADTTVATLGSSVNTASRSLLRPLPDPAPRQAATLAPPPERPLAAAPPPRQPAPTPAPVSRDRPLATDSTAVPPGSLAQNTAPRIPRGQAPSIPRQQLPAAPLPEPGTITASPPVAIASNPQPAPLPPAREAAPPPPSRQPAPPPVPISRERSPATDSTAIAALSRDPETPAIPTPRGQAMAPQRNTIPRADTSVVSRSRPVIPLGRDSTDPLPPPVVAVAQAAPITTAEPTPDTATLDLETPADDALETVATPASPPGATGVVATDETIPTAPAERPLPQTGGPPPATDLAALSGRASRLPSPPPGATVQPPPPGSQVLIPPPATLRDPAATAAVDSFSPPDTATDTTGTDNQPQAITADQPEAPATPPEAIAASTDSEQTLAMDSDGGVSDPREDPLAPVPALLPDGTPDADDAAIAAMPAPETTPDSETVVSSSPSGEPTPPPPIVASATAEAPAPTTAETPPPITDSPTGETPVNTAADSQLALAAPPPAASPPRSGGGGYDSCQIQELFEGFVSVYLKQGERTVLMLSFAMSQAFSSAEQVLQVLSSGSFEPASYFPYAPETPDAVRDALGSGRVQCQLTPVG